MTAISNLCCEVVCRGLRNIPEGTGGIPSINFDDRGSQTMPCLIRLHPVLETIYSSERLVKHAYCPVCCLQQVSETLELVRRGVM